MEGWRCMLLSHSKGKGSKRVWHNTSCIGVGSSHRGCRSQEWE